MTRSEEYQESERRRREHRKRVQQRKAKREERECYETGGESWTKKRPAANLRGVGKTENLKRKY